MFLDMPTISVVSFGAATVTGLVLCFVWSQERTSPLIGWWGVAQLLTAAGIAFAASASFSNSAPLSAFGQALIILSAAIMWMAVREFEGRQLNSLWVAIWPSGFIIAAAAGLTSSYDQRIILASALVAVLYFLAAAEFARHDDERIVTRRPACALLIVMGIAYVAWMPLGLMMPIQEVGRTYASSWLPITVLIATLGRIALSIVVLATVKERQEMRQRMFALTDSLTGLPNRRALFEAADALAVHIRATGSSISVMVLDLDHFKRVNDTHGHRLGDRVLQQFSRTLATEIGDGSIVGRLGGEEFAAILPGCTLGAAQAKAERVRAAFADAATVVDGLPVSGTVSIGVAAHSGRDCDIGALFHRADSALYVAKQAGRNRVAVVGAQEPTCEAETTLDSAWQDDRRMWSPMRHATRRHRDFDAA